MSSVARKYNLVLNQAQQQFSEYLNGIAPFGAKQILLACATYPSAGTISLEYRLIGDATWRKVPKATALPLIGPMALYAFGSIEEYRVTLAGIVGGSGLAAWVSDIDAEGAPPGLFDGTRAMTTQSYIEANVKNGNQFEASALNSGVVALTGTVGVIFETGALPVIVKIRKIDTNAHSATARVYRDPVYTGGVSVPYFNLNLKNPAVGLAVIKSGANITSNGVEIAAPTFIIGSVGQGQQNLGTYTLAGIERRLAENSKYLLLITNTGTDPADIATYLSWYEGQPDLPL